MKTLVMILITFLCVGTSWANKTGPATVDLDAPLPHVLQVNSVEIYPKKADGKRWDSIGAGGPDLLVQVFANGHQVLLSKVRKDSFATQWESLITEKFDLNTPNSTIRVVVLDKDLREHDTIGEVTFSPTVDHAKNNKMFRLAGGRIKELRVTVRLAATQDVAKPLSNKEDTKTVPATPSKSGAAELAEPAPAEPAKPVPTDPKPAEPAPTK